MAEQKHLVALSRFLQRPAKVTAVKNNVLVLKENGLNVEGFLSIAKHLTRTSNQQALLGRTPAEQAFVDQWLEYMSLNLDGKTDKYSGLQDLNSYLSDRVFIAGNSTTLADLLLFFVLHQTMSELTFQEKEKFLHLSRWYDNLQYQYNFQESYGKLYFQKNCLYSGSS
ncbi:eukaryotic translation elongation factor 1 epsilon-1-like [Argonauta hians]